MVVYVQGNDYWNYIHFSLNHDSCEDFFVYFTKNDLIQTKKPLNPTWNLASRSWNLALEVRAAAPESEWQHWQQQLDLHRRAVQSCRGTGQREELLGEGARKRHLVDVWSWNLWWVLDGCCLAGLENWYLIHVGVMVWHLFFFSKTFKRYQWPENAGRYHAEFDYTSTIKQLMFLGFWCGFMVAASFLPMISRESHMDDI